MGCTLMFWPGKVILLNKFRKLALVLFVIWYCEKDFIGKNIKRKTTRYITNNLTNPKLCKDLGGGNFSYIMGFRD